ncbi:hypothetical protein J4E86_002495 [Alternaria arbusti]|uniref:uncharacterized protein n=1 Tax=Alternaria arbusti TaxID=232088 RepID=UPI002220DB51|nr:uncharacterized protein J4E86_002495 [Alternaria arbusti]KAI4960869.1 hypothetical protein J4E86_002495 [Alternaria arbusti]
MCMDEPEDCGGACNEYGEDNGSDGNITESDEGESPSGTNDASAQSNETSQAQETVGAAAISTPQPAPPRNLDAGGPRYWEDQDLDFGEEPGEDHQDRSWNCDHSFETYRIPLAKALINDSAAEMECRSKHQMLPQKALLECRLYQQAQQQGLQQDSREATDEGQDEYEGDDNIYLPADSSN